MDTTTTKDKLARFGRAFALLLNRGLMYHKSHPMVIESIKEVCRIAEMIFVKISPLVFILNRQQFYIDEEQLDPRINTKRVATLFKSHKIQSISFDNGLSPSELDIFIDIFSSLKMSMDAEYIKKVLFSRGAFNIKINHVLYKKVTEDDQIISREALKEVTPAIEAEDSKSRKKFMDTLLETILTEEFANTLNIKSLLANPRMVSQNMIKADLAGARELSKRPPGKGTRKGMGTLPMEEEEDGSQSVYSGPDRGHGARPEGPGKGGSAGQGPGTGGAGIAAGDGIGTGAVAVGLQATGPYPYKGKGDANSQGMAGAGMNAGGGPAPGTDASGSDTAGIGPGTGLEDFAGSHGPMLLRQLEFIQAEVQKQLQDGGDISLEDLADAVFEMKKQFFEDLQTQKALGIAYANEEAIVDNLNQLTDQVILKLIQEEYDAGKITTQRLAQIILRLIPEPQELRRLLPQIKEALIGVGMPPQDYLDLIDSLKKELQNEDLIRILEESSEAIGVKSSELIDEFRRNPEQSAKLIYLASEIGKGSGDEAALSDILVEYVEKMTTQAAQSSPEKIADGDAHLKKVVSDVEATLFQQLGKLNVGDDVLGRMEARINERMDSILDKMRVEWLNAQTGISRKKKHIRLSVLQTLEHSVNDDEELTDILKVVRAKVEAGEIEENNFSQIDAEITQQRKILEKQAAAQQIPAGILNSDELIFILEKEIARAHRYNAGFSALAFSFVSAKPRMKALDKIVTADAIMTAALEKLVSAIREVDYIGQIGRNKMVAVLPMAGYVAAKAALMRVMNLLHSKPLKVHEVPVDLRVAGIVAQFNPEQTATAQAFAKQLSNQLMDMVSRVKNIQVLF